MIALFLSIFVIGVTADYPVNLERNLFENFELRNDVVGEKLYRLPENVVPLEYDIEIDMNFEATAERPEFSYNGVSTIVIMALEQNISQIILHANVDRIGPVNLFTSNGVPHPLNPNNPTTLEPQYHFLKVNLNEPLSVAANYTLSISYSSTMNEGPLKRGIWRGHYIDGQGTKRTYAATHFQPYNARQAFPCWDEPLFKAIFKIHIIRPANFSKVYHNTGIESTDELPNNRVRENFLPTPKMSSYLVTFLVSESFEVIAEDRSLSPPVRIIGRSNTVGLGEFALKMAVGMTRFFEQYLGIPYASLHPNLNNDHISSPDWASAGTENWGMVSYRELYMIVSSQETTMATEHYAATLISHELAHKWFGNLITCYWWSNTWINEGFASYFGYMATYQVFPEYDHHEHFNSRYLQGSLSTDSSTTSVPLNYDVNTPSQVTGHFGTISYSKGAAFLRMVADMITEDTFRKACNYFLTTYAYEPTYPQDLFEAFNRAVSEDGTLQEYANFDFENYFNVWVNEPGYPILQVDIDYSTGQISLKQERFFLSASATPTNQVYPIPITYSTESDPNFLKLKPDFIMAAESQVINKDPGEEWVIFNNLQHGHYRVNYNERNWELIADTLLNDPESIPHLTRAQIVDDVYALMRSKRMSWEFGFQILKFLRTETNFHVWDPAITLFNWLTNRLSHLPESKEEFTSFVLSYMEHVIESFDAVSEETPTIIMNRQAIGHFACLLGHEKCIEDAKDVFATLKQGVWIEPKRRRTAYVVGIREGNVDDYEFLLNRFLTSNFANDQLEMLRGLGAARDPTLVMRTLELILTDAVRTQDKVNAFNYVLLGNPENSAVALQFLKDNADAVRRIFQEDAPNNPVHSVFSNLASYLDEDGLAEYENWLQTTQTNTLQYSTGISAINSARNNRAWGTANAGTILAAARAGAAQIVSSAILMMALCFMAIFPN